MSEKHIKFQLNNNQESHIILTANQQIPVFITSSNVDIEYKITFNNSFGETTANTCKKSMRFDLAKECSAFVVKNLGKAPLLIETTLIYPVLQEWDNGNPVKK